MLRRCCLLSCLVLTLACDGERGSFQPGPGSAVDGGAPPAGQVPTYGSTSLPGRLFVNKGAAVGTARRAAAFDLRTGRRTLLPASSAPDAEAWSAGGRADVVVRVVAMGSGSAVAFFDAQSLAPRGGALTLARDHRGAQLSADGRYLLTFVDNTLTILDATSGSVVESGSQLDGYSVLGSPAAWLPDGRYVYLAGKSLYATAPGQPDTALLAELAGLPGPTPSAVMNADLAVSPDGRRLALSWRDLDSEDSDLWVAGLDGVDLRPLTRQPPSDPALDYTHGSPAWSPDSRWVAGVLYMSGTSSSPVYPSEPFLGDRVTGSTGCVDQVFVVDASGPAVALSWPSFDATHGVKVVAAAGSGGEWLSTCSARVAWLP